ncbi:MAG: restriction endonuclease subunit S [Candidatus Competibacter denitrificans]
MVPEDWECNKLEDYFSLISYGFTNPMPTVEHGVYMITAADINEGRIQLESARKTTETAYRTLLTAKSKPRKNDILLTKDGSLGRLALVGDETICINQSVAVIRPNEKVEPRFLKLLLESPYYQRRMLEDAGGSTIKHIYITIVNLMAVGLPANRIEQRAIATALSDVDALLDGLARLIAKKRDLKQATMQQLLTGQTRLPGFSGGWEVKRLGEIGQFLKGSGVKKDEASSGILPCIRYGELYTHHNEVIREFNSWISPEVANTALKLRKGDLLFAGSGETKEEIGKCASFVSDCEAYAGGDIVILRPVDVDPTFMGYYCNTRFINTQKASKGQGDAVVHISATALASISVVIPHLAEQTAIAAILSDLDAELAALEARLTKTRALKQAMMQELLTGRIRLL